MQYRYVSGVVFGTTLALCAAVGSFIITLGIPHESGRWVNECLTIKKAATVKHDPKIIILSGSNSLFGFSAERLTNMHGVKAVNAAVHAGLGIDYILHYGRQHFGAGRTFVLPLEYQLYGQRKLANGALLYQIGGYDPHYFWHLSLTDKLITIGEITPMDRVRLFKNFLSAVPRSEDGYQSKTLNAYGDETANTVASRTNAMAAKVKAEAPAAYSHDEAAWQAIAKFSTEAKAAGIEVVLTYPNIYSGALDTKLNEHFFRELAVRANRIGLRVVGTPQGSAFNDEAIFDTSYHQNTQGQIRSTDRLIRELRTAKII